MIYPEANDPEIGDPETDAILKKKAERAIARLKTLYPVGKWHSPDPFKVLISTVLSQRTRDEVTEKASERLFGTYDTAASLAKADIDAIECLIKDVGFYRVKAARIKEISQILVNRYGGAVPDDMNELLTLPGVGRKTANCVLVYGFKKDAVAVDTHVHRISNRLGIVNTKRPDGTELQLMKIVERSDWQVLNELFISFGKDLCRPIGPKCDICGLSDLCIYYSRNKQN